MSEATAGIYARVSTRRQDEASQLPDLQRWAKAQDGEARWYRDKFTGREMNRPGWNQLEADFRQGTIRTIVIWRLDRLGRTASGLTALFDELKARKVNLVSLRDGLDLSTPAGTLMANVLASVAQYETEVRAERVLAGLEVARTRGVRLGRPALTDGQRGKRLKVNPDMEALVKRLREQQPLATVAYIARSVGLSRPTVYKILRG